MHDLAFYLFFNRLSDELFKELGLKCVIILLSRERAVYSRKKTLHYNNTSLLGTAVEFIFPTCVRIRIYSMDRLAADTFVETNFTVRLF